MKTILEYFNQFKQNKILSFLLIFVFCIIAYFAFMPETAKPQIDTETIDIKDAIAIVGSTLGVKIIVDGNIEGQIELELENKTPREIKESLEQVLNAEGFVWVSEGGVVHITKNPKGIKGISNQQLPLSYYIGVISRNNLFRPLGIKPVELKTDLILTGIMGIGDGSRAIIEDTINHKSYYISKGDSVGDLKVIDITDKQVILDGARGRMVLKIQQKIEPQIPVKQ